MTGSEGYSMASNYVFTLPVEVLEQLTLRKIFRAPESPLKPSASISRAKLDEVTSLGCTACGVTSFESLSDQRSHFATDWHRYNVKVRLGNQAKPPVGEEEFLGLIDALEESLSGSDSSSDNSSDSSTNAVSRLLKESHIDHNEEDIRRNLPRSPVLWFTADPPARETQFGIYRAIFPFGEVRDQNEPPGGWPNLLKSLQVQPVIPKSTKKLAVAGDHIPLEPTNPVSSTWTLIMVGGGHFAGMVVSLVPKMSRGQGGRLDQDVIILAHKTFHRYTTRRKQGGSQATNDNAKGNAKSAGAGLRRYNEQALQDDIRALLAEWREWINDTSLIFLRASRTNLKIFYNYNDAVLVRSDPRIRSLPFPTRRPTLAELTRCFNELTRVKISNLSADALAALDEEYLNSLKPKPSPAPFNLKLTPAIIAPKLSAEELVKRDRWERVIDMTRRGRLEPLTSFVERHSTSDDPDWCGELPEWTEAAIRRSTPTLLHVASAADQSEVVRWLLYERKADPTRLGVETSRTAYEVAGARSVRNIFRRCMAEHPDWWDWTGSARVPTALTEEQEAEQKAKSTERKNKLRSKMRERERERDELQKSTEEAERKAKEEEERRRKERVGSAPGRTGPQRLGGPGAKAATIDLDGLTDQQRMRIDRERRARAAEARLQSR